MFDFRLKVFYTVATRLNFTRAAEELFITQPAVTKHIREIESHYNIRLFNRNGTKISLTPEGELLLKHAGQYFNIYHDFELQLAAANRRMSGALRIGASTTMAQYVLPACLAAFNKRFADIKTQLSTGNTEFVETQLMAGKIDLGIIEGQLRRKDLRYVPFLKDEMVLCTRTNNKQALKGNIKLKELPALPLLLREQGSGSLDVVLKALKKAGLNASALKVQMRLEGTESIKSYLLDSDCFAFLSIHSIGRELQNGLLRIVDIDGINITRHFSYIRQQGDNKGIADVFCQYLTSYNFK